MGEVLPPRDILGNSEGGFDVTMIGGYYWHSASRHQGNGAPLQHSCLENPMVGGAWWAAVHEVTKSPTWLRDSTFTFHFSLSCIGEGNDNPLQCSCLENPRDGGAWWAAVYEVAQSRTRLKQLSSSRSSYHSYLLCSFARIKEFKVFLVCFILITVINDWK